MASTFNTKAVHKDGKSELKIGIDDNSKTIIGIDKSILIKNLDGSPALISSQNIPCIPENANENNKLVTQEDLNKMMAKINNAMSSMQDAMNALIELSEIVGTEELL